MKKALVLLHRELKNYDARILATIHDEFQIEAKPEITDRVGQLAVQCIEKAGKHFQLRVPVTGEYRVGNNWAETH